MSSFYAAAPWLTTVPQDEDGWTLARTGGLAGFTTVRGYRGETIVRAAGRIYRVWIYLNDQT